MGFCIGTEERFATASQPPVTATQLDCDRAGQRTSICLFYLAQEEKMARLSYVELDQASPEVREIYEKALGGKPGSVFKLLAPRPEVLKQFLPFYGSIGKALPHKLYEMVYIRVSA